MFSLSRTLFVLFGMIHVSLFSQCTIADGIELVPVPKWVSQQTVNYSAKVPIEQVQDGTYHLLLDSQNRIQKNGQQASYLKRAQKITNPTGVEQNSQLNFNYSPAYEKIAIHSISIYRDNHRIDKFYSSEIKVLEQESEAKNLIYNGTKTINVILSDVQVNDVLEYEYSIIGANPVFEGTYDASFYLQWSVPVQKRSVRVLWEKSNTLFHKQHISNHPIQIKQFDTATEYRVELTDIAPIQTESYTPSWFNKYPFIEFSEFADWKAVVNWGTPLFDGAISQSSQISQIAETIKSQHPQPEMQIIEALHFTQHNIRYLGIEIGVNSHKPSNADETLTRKYGDCKDKTVLFLSILKALGIQASPALVNTDLDLALGKRLAGPRWFDHVIAKVILDNKTYWLDPTRQYQQNRLNDIFQPDYGLALVLNNDASQLEKVQIDHSSNYQKITETFTLNDDSSLPVSFHVLTELTGLKAENARRKLATDGASEVENSYLKFYQDYYTEVKIAEPIKFYDSDSDNYSDNYSIEENYLIEKFWHLNDEGDRQNAWFYPDSITSFLSRDNTKARKDPLAISYPENLQHVIHIKLDDANWEFSNETFTEDNPYFSFSHSVNFQKEENILTLTYQYQSKVDFIGEKDLKAYDAILEKLEDYSSYGIYQTVGGTNKTTNEEFSEKDKAIAVLVGMLLFFALPIICLVMWRRYHKKHQHFKDALFYPVTPIKFVVLSVLTFGIFLAYWFYRNFKYIQKTNRPEIYPFWRGFFSVFWYYPLYSALKTHQKKLTHSAWLPHKGIAVLLAVIYFVVSIFANIELYYIISLFVLALILLPLLSYINRVNDQQAIDQLSQWKAYHFLLAIFSIPLLLMSAAQNIGVLPSPKVVSGEHLMAYDIKFLQRKSVLSPGEKVEYFYSDASLFIRDDGNGFSNDKVFSYWLDENFEFNVETAKYADIQDIEVTWAESIFDTTIIKVIRNDKDASHFLLFVSPEDKKDKVFVEALKRHWRANS